MYNQQYTVEHYKNDAIISDENPNLSLFIGNQLFAYCLFNEKFTSVIEICDVKIENQGIKNEDLPEKLRFLFTNYRLDQRRFKNVNVCILNTFFTLTPEAFAIRENAKTFLEFTQGSDGENKNAFTHKFDQLNFCYTITDGVMRMLERTFKNATVRHAGAITIDLLFNNTSLKNCNLFLNFNTGVFELAAKENNKLLYYNVFNYDTNEDVLYYLLFMMEQYELNPLTCKLVIAGQMETDSELLKAIRKYVKQVFLAVNDKSFSESFAGIKLPDHYFFSLANQHLCAL